MPEPGGDRGGGRRLRAFVKPVHRCTIIAAVTASAIPEATVGRLPVYLRALVEFAEAGSPTVSSEALAAATGVNSAKVRKDRRTGVLRDARRRLRRRLSPPPDPPRAGADAALADRDRGHREPRARARQLPWVRRARFRPAALVDNDPAKVGEQVGESRIRAIDDLGRSPASTTR